ncbi:stage III sporulation protein AD [Sporanaerobacter acetigenes]|uniref:Stage III sporulation protein AD n=1 Tax=Sporanaerobacter acetigenes DSM 13106 TaxID=1123281 RepID=A0A1M5TU93_9FIRM|nr:stage III sporulation protein AD [Sporanaerobacter acetigenes]SHH54357.1 stage III sporulation protein AD [Sporanaerobacter acetigenes DSM 13106]
MEVLQIVVIGIIATVMIMLLKDEKPEFAILISIATSIVIFYIVADKLKIVVQVLTDMAKNADVDFIFFTTILKIIGIAYIVEFGAQISRDAGEESIASKIELGGKVVIMVLAIPIFMALMDLIFKILP